MGDDISLAQHPLPLFIVVAYLGTSDKALIGVSISRCIKEHDIESYCNRASGIIASQGVS